jgi:hypothetical protein
MWKHYAMAILTLGLWACAPAEEGEELPGDATQVRRELVQTVGPLQRARFQHTSTRLLNGKVLYAGGGGSSYTDLLASAELYDPATGTTSLVAPMNLPRRAHTAVLLRDGSVLVLGGLTNESSTASVERYEPSTNTWTLMAPMPRSSYGHSATLLADGRVLVAGGVGYYTSVYLFHPTTNTWTQTGSLEIGRMHAATLRLPDNRVLTMGGSAARSGDGRTAEIYDPSTGTWSTRAGFLFEYGGSSAVLLPNGRVVRNTGHRASEYDVATDTWTLLPEYNHSHNGGALVLVDGALVVMGNAYDERSIERFDPVLRRWNVVDQLSALPRDYSTVDVLADNSVVIAGGIRGSVTSATMELLPGSGTCAPRTCAAAGAQCGSIPDGCGGTLGCGSCGTGSTCSSTHLCEPDVPTQDFTLTPIRSNRIIARGGWATYPITTSGSGTISLSFSGIPAGSSAYFGSSTLQAGESTFFQVQTMEGFVGAGHSTITITGTNGTHTHSTPVTLMITSAQGSSPLVNGGFETGALSGWSSTGSASVGSGARSGGFTAVVGSPSNVLTGDSTLSQSFIVPAAGALLRFWFLGHAVDAPSDYASVLLRDHSTGLTTALIERTYARPPYDGWVSSFHDLMDYAGHRVTLTFVSHEAGWGGAAYTFIDDVSVLVPSDFAVGFDGFDTLTAPAGSTVTYSVKTSGQGTINLSLSGLPAGISGTFSPATVTAGQPSTLTVTTTSALPAGSYIFNIKGTEASTQLTRWLSANLNITANQFSYTASNTNSAQQNTTQSSLVLEAGKTLTLGTCGVTGASFSGDTYLRLYNPSGIQVAFSDNACGGLGSNFTYTVPAGAGGTYQVRAGCFSSGSCSGTVAWTLTDPPPPPPPGSAALTYTAVSTSSATVNTVNRSISLLAGQILTLGTCGVTGSSFSGDTYLRLYNPSGTQVAFSDDACGGVGSNFTYTVPAGAGGSYQLRAGCYASGSCSGTAAWTLR